MITFSRMTAEANETIKSIFEATSKEKQKSQQTQCAISTTARESPTAYPETIARRSLKGLAVQRRINTTRQKQQKHRATYQLRKSNSASRISNGPSRNDRQHNIQGTFMLERPPEDAHDECLWG
eukprot:3501254-Pyramimonas_sp.AAC.1